MAHIILDDFIDVGSGADIDAVSWQIATDKYFNDIIDKADHVKIEYDPNKKLVVHSMLPKKDGSGYHADLSVLYARIKIHSGEYESEWFVIGPEDQNDQQVVITEKGKEDIYTTSLAIDLH